MIELTAIGIVGLFFAFMVVLFCIWCIVALCVAIRSEIRDLFNK